MELNLNLLQDASNRFRANLNSLEPVDQYLYNAIFRDDNYLNSSLNYHSLTSNKPILAGNQNTVLKSIQTNLYFNNRLLKEVSKHLDERSRYFNSNLNSLKQDYKKINDGFVSTFLKVKENYTKVVSKSVFDERGFDDLESLYDSKKDSMFLRSYQAEYRKGCIESAYRQVNKILPAKCTVVSVSKSDGILNALAEMSEDTDYFYREDKSFKCIICKKQIKENNAQVKDLEVHLELIFHFDREETLNQLNVDFGSALPVLLEKDDLFYWDGAQYQPTNFYFSNETFNKKEYYFDDVKTTSLKMKFTQRKSHSDILTNEETTLNQFLRQRDYVEANPAISETIKVFDLSIDNVEFFYKTYKQYSFYREKDYVSIFGLKNLNLRVEEINVDENCFVEKEIEIVVIKEDARQEKYFVPIPSSHKIREVLTPKHGKATLTFPKNTVVKIYQNGELLPSVNNYSLLVDGLTNGTSNQVYSCEVIFKDTFTYYPDDIFIAEYITKDSISFNNEISIGTQNIIIKNINKKYIYSFSPKFIFRNKSKNNESNIIKSYTLLVSAETPKVQNENTFTKMKVKEIEVSTNA